MAIKYKGEVEFADSTGQKFVLRLGMNQFVAASKDLDALEGRAYQRAMFHLALINGADSQKDFTEEDAGEIIDDLGFVRANELIAKTKFGHNVDEASKSDERQRQMALSIASDTLIQKIAIVRGTTKDAATVKALDRLEAEVKALAEKPEGSANPPMAMALSA